jgi:FtsP/CotA-like multicopper oxidase with cupredoxin domain
MVREGDVVRMRISNTSGEVHPMHLHGHHAVVLARDGVPATGSPWWVDSLDVPDGATFDVAFVADNPGLWMDHCHNLAHPKQGLVAHLMYEGVTTPYRAGADTPNDPE